MSEANSKTLTVTIRGIECKAYPAQKYGFDQGTALVHNEMVIGVGRDLEDAAAKARYVIAKFSVTQEGDV